MSEDFIKPCPNGTFSATPLTPNQPGLAASIPSSLVNLVLTDFETFTSTVDEIIEADDTWQYIQDNLLDILKTESALFACIIIGILYIILVPLSGLIVCLCHCCRSKYRDGKESSWCSVVWRVGTGIFGLVVLVAGIFVFLGNAYTDDAIRNLEPAVEDTFRIPSGFINSMSKQLDCYFNDYVVFEGNLVEELADEKHGEEVKTIITGQKSYINTVSNLTALESQANKTIDKLSDIARQADKAEEEGKQFETALNQYSQGQCKTDCNGNPICTSECDNIQYDNNVVEEANKQLQEAYKILKDSEVLSVSQLIDTEINKIPELINAETKKVADQLTAPGGPLEDAKKEIKKALDDIGNTFDGFEDAISDVYNDINEYFDEITKYNKIRSAVYIVLGVLILVISLLSIIGSLIPKPKAGTVLLKASVGLGFIFSVVFMALTIVFFVGGSFADRYACQPFQPNDDMTHIEGLTYVQTKIGEIKIGDYPIILNEFITTCQADKGIAKAANLENMLDDAVDKDAILEKIDEQMKVINDTYDDIVKDLELDKHIKTLNDYKTPPELAEGKKQLDAAETQIDDLMKKLDNLSNVPANLKKEAGDLQAAMSTLNTGVDELITEADKIEGSIDGVVTPLTAFMGALDTDIKDEIYNEIGFLKEDIIGFADQIVFSFKNDFGKCKPIFQTYDNLTIIICSYVTNSLNALWFALGWAAAFLIPLLIFANQTSKTRNQDNITITPEVDASAPPPDYSYSKSDLPQEMR